MALRYLIVNTVHSLKSLLSSESKEFQYNAKGDYEFEIYSKIKEYSILLTHLYDILSILLKHLLSTHVDNYRDDTVIENTVSLLIIIINYLYENFENSQQATNSGSHSQSKTNLQYIMFSASNIHVIEHVQNLFDSSLKAFKEICKFNTTIKLNFEKILERIAEKPSNKSAMVYILNFMFNVVSNEYTIETFVEVLSKIQKLPQVDVYTELENETYQKRYHLKIGHLSAEKSFINYVSEMGALTNNDWLRSNCGNLLISILIRFSDKSKSKVFEEILDYNLNLLKKVANKKTLFNKKITFF